jgi:hypothetical protein
MTSSPRAKPVALVPRKHPSDGPMTGAVGRAGPRRWLIEIAGGESHLVGSDEELRDLVRRRQVTGETRVYEIGAGPHALRSIPELAHLLPDAEESEPPIRRPHLQLETRSPERIKLSEELAILDRPLEDEIEYYDEAPRSRAKPALVVLMILAALGGGYLLLTQRHRADVPDKALETEPMRTPSRSESPAAPEPEGDPPPSAPGAGQ